MQIDADTVARLAHLARLDFPEAQTDRMVADLNRMLAFVEKLNELDTTGVPPLIYMNLPDHNVLRPDEPQQEITHAQALQNAPKADSDFFRVPKVLAK